MQMGITGQADYPVPTPNITDKEEYQVPTPNLTSMNGGPGPVISISKKNLIVPSSEIDTVLNE